MASWRNRVIVLVLALLLHACGGEPPPSVVAVRPPALDLDDLAVMRAALDDLRERDPGARRFLVVDSTVAVCARPPDVFGAPPGGCLGPQAIESLSRVLPSGSRLTAMGTFRERNAVSLPIPEALGADVTFISATLVDFVPVNELVARHPGGAVVSFSAPAHVAPGLAVIVYQAMGAEYTAARFARAPDGRWRVFRQPDADSK